MAKGFIARYNGTCAKCSKAIVAHKHYITWSRLHRGVAYHLDCAAPEVAPVASAEPAPERRVIAPAPAPETRTPSTPSIEEITRAVTASLASQFGIDPAPTVKASAPSLKALNNKSPWWSILTALVDADVAHRILVIGPPGTGKSTAACNVAPTYYRKALAPDMGSEDLKGTWKLIDKETQYQDGLATRALREGATLVLDEVDMASAECVSLLFPLLDKPAWLELPTGETVQAAKGYRVIATSNNTHEALLPAIADRFEVILDARTCHEAILAPMSRRMRLLTERRYDALTPLAWRREPTSRCDMMFDRLTQAGCADAVAARLVWGDACAEILSALATIESGTATEEVAE